MSLTWPGISAARSFCMLNGTRRRVFASTVRYSTSTVLGPRTRLIRLRRSACFECGRPSSMRTGVRGDAIDSRLCLYTAGSVYGWFICALSKKGCHSRTLGWNHWDFGGPGVIERRKGRQSWLASVSLTPGRRGTRRRLNLGTLVVHRARSTP